MNSIILVPSQFLLTPPMDLNQASRGSEPISSLPLRLRTNNSVGQFGARRGSESLIRAHIALDLLAPSDEEVFASARGVIVQVGGDSPTDRFVTIHHQPFDLGIVTSYRHLHSLTVTKGQTVASGKKIGQVAAGSPSHLHFEFRQIFNQSLLNEYLLIYNAGPTLPDNIALPADPNTNPITRYVFDEVTNNIGSTGHSLPLNPTRSLYNWEKNGFKNDLATRHVTPRGKLVMFDEVVRDRMLRFVRVQVAGNTEEIFLPLVDPTPDEISLLDTLRTAFFRQKEVRLVWRDSLFYAEVQPPLMKLLVEVKVHP